MNKFNSKTAIYLNLVSEKDKIRQILGTIIDDRFPIAITPFPIRFKKLQSLSNIISLIKTLDYDFSTIQILNLTSGKNGTKYITVNEIRLSVIKKLIELFTKNNIEFDATHQYYNKKKKIVSIAEAEYDDKNYYEEIEKLSKNTLFKRNNAPNSFEYEEDKIMSRSFFSWKEPNDVECNVTLIDFKNNTHIIDSIRLDFKEDVNDASELFELDTYKEYYNSVDEFNQHVKETIRLLIKGHSDIEPVILNQFIA